MVLHSRLMQRILPLGIPRCDSHSENRPKTNKYTKYNKNTDQINTYFYILVLLPEVRLQNTLKHSNYLLTTELPLVTLQIPTESHFTPYNPIIPS